MSDGIKKVVRKEYGKIAKSKSSCCEQSCCSGSKAGELALDVDTRIGYSEEDVKAAPEGANLGLGCGNPVALASLRTGETVLDLGSGAGFDCFLAASKVGSKGRVIGVDMTSEMIEKARDNATKSNYVNVEFRPGEIENLPVADNSVDIVISNCVINLSPDKKRVFKESFRVLKPTGRLMVSDIVLLKELPDFIKNSVEAYVGCLSGAIMKDQYIAAIKDAGFLNVRILGEKQFPIENMANDPSAKAVDNLKPEGKAKNALNSAASIEVFGTKPNDYSS